MSFKFAFHAAKYSFIHNFTPKMSKNLLERIQMKRFRRLVQYAYQNSLYYKQLIVSHKIDPTTCVPEDFPIMNKQITLDHFNEISTVPSVNLKDIRTFLDTSQYPGELYQNKYVVIHSSGTTGQVGYFVYSPSEFAAGTAFPTRVGGGFPLFQRSAFVGATRGHYAGVAIANTTLHLKFLGNKTLHVDSGEPFEQIIAKLNHFQPHVLSAYAFLLARLAQAQSEGRLKIAPTTLRSSGEPLTTEEKTFVERTFKTPVINVYASSETLVLGAGREGTCCIVLNDDESIVELHSDGVVVTPLFSRTLPLIRNVSRNLRQFSHLFNITNFPLVPPIRGADTAPR